MSPPERTRAMDALRSRVNLGAPESRPLPLALLSGAVLVVGLAVGASVLLEDAGVPLGPPLLVFIGLGLCGLQVRSRHGRQAYIGLGIGLLGATLVFVGGRALSAAHGPGWSWLTWVALALAGASVALAFLHRPRSPTWRELRSRLQDELAALRRAFVATVIAGLVLFPFAPLLEALFTALGWAFSTPYRMAVVAYLTVAAFLALELVGAWYALGHGERREREQRAERVAASESLLSELERAPTASVEATT